MKIVSEKIKPFLGYFLVLLSVAPQIAFALGKPEIAVPLQDLYQALTLGVPPGLVQATAATAGALALHTTEKPEA